MPPLQQQPTQSRRSFWTTSLALMIITQVFSLICWNLLPRLSPILLDKAGASSALIAIVLGTIPQGITLLLTPVISLWSDKTRTRIGRRIPFLWWSAPFVCLILLGIGQCNNAAFLLSALLILFSLASLIPATLVFYLIPDAIPMHAIGRFSAWNGALCSLSTACFNYCFLGWSTRHPAAALSIAALAYAITMLLLPLIREKEYPPPVNSQIKLLSSLKEYANNCFAERLFLLIFLAMGLNQASMILRTMFGILFATKTLGMTADTFGRISGICAIAGALTAITVGHFVDKKGALKIYLHGSYLIIFVSLAGFLFIKSPLTYAIIAIMTTICYSIQSTAYTPLLVNIFPQNIYGQLSSANSTVCAIIVMIGASLGGWITGLFGYRVMFLWDMTLTSLATFCLIIALHKRS